MSSAIMQTLQAFGITQELSIPTTHQLTNDSRQVQSNDIFCAVIGSQSDGRKYVKQAVEQGAVCIISECIHPQQHGKITWIERCNKAGQALCKIPVIHFYQLNRQLFELAKHYYQQPNESMSLIGVTGTNGKTSTCLLIAKLLNILEEKSAVIGTIGAGIIQQSDDKNDHISALTAIDNTTPGATKLMQLLAQFNNERVKHVAMEVSSHALVQQRIDPSCIDIAVFTNLSRDHLDYHQTMTAYASAKRLIFTNNNRQIAILNGDDGQSKHWLAELTHDDLVIVYGKNSAISHYSRYVLASNIEHHQQGVSFTLTTEKETVTIQSPLLGDFNVDNLLAAIAVLLAKNIALSQIVSAISSITPITGRMEVFSAPEKPTAIVDYAHTPDALLKALVACKQHCHGELWVVFGCGGDRDKGKRAEMGSVAETYADHVIVTNDNPRHEAPELIAQQILKGCKNTEKVTVQLDRAQAVLSSLAKAKPNDMVLMAGKGHEDYIMIGDTKIAYNERQQVASFYQKEGML